VLSKKGDFIFRLTITRLILVATFVLLGSRLWYLQIVEGARFRQEAEGNRRRTILTSPLRGRIFDRQGNVLADNIPSFSLLAMVNDLPEDEAARAHMLDQLCTALTCTGSLYVAPTEVSPEVRQEVYPWLISRVGWTWADLAQRVEAGQLFSATLQLDDTAANWLRGEISRTAGLTYTNALEQSLLKNAGPLYLPVPVADNIPRDRALAIEEHRLDFPGIFLQTEPLRLYPLGAKTAHVVGYIGRISPEELVASNPDPLSGKPVHYLAADHIGKVGAEAAYEDILRGQLGAEEIQVDAGGHPVGAPISQQQAVPGYDIVLTLDTDLQTHASEILRQGIIDANKKQRSYYRPIYSGVAVAMDPRNGQILAMVSLPSYDNNAFVQGMTVEEYTTLIENPQHPLLNRAIGGEYPVGSTFKLVVAGAGLQEGVITPQTLIWDHGAILVPNRYDAKLPPQVFPCWNRAGHGRINVITALQVSCNVFFFTVAGGTPEAKFADGVGIDRLARYANAYGYGEPTHLGFPGEVDGLIPTPEWKQEVLGEVWVQGDLYNMAIGQGNILATPLQALGAVATVANGGTRYRPQLLLRVVDSQGQVVQGFSPIVEQKLPVDPEYLAIIREGLRKSCAEGPNYYTRDHEIIPIAGKTGSAEYGPFLRPGDRQTHSWFVAFAPYDDPQLAIVVMVEGGGNASTVAVPIATDIINYYFSRPAPGGAATPP
jgi:penicillin-binding protein 2